MENLTEMLRFIDNIGGRYRREKDLILLLYYFYLDRTELNTKRL